MLHMELTANCRYDGLNFTPSVRMATGASRRNEMIVIMEKRLILSKAPL